MASAVVAHEALERPAQDPALLTKDEDHDVKLFNDWTFEDIQVFPRGL